jgi:hypothetical protein
LFQTLGISLDASSTSPSMSRASRSAAATATTRSLVFIRGRFFRLLDQQAGA